LYDTVFSRSTGEGGNLIVQTPQLIIRDGGRIAASSEGAGNARQIEISADIV
jgi:large exoprotein involved in heme utilization and adhesion